MPSDVEYPTKLVIFNAFFVCACQFGPVPNVSVVIVIIARKCGAQITEAELSVSAHVKRPSSAHPDVSAALPGVTDVTCLGFHRGFLPSRALSWSPHPPGIRLFARRIILGIVSSREGAKFGELGTPAYIPDQLAVLLFPTRSGASSPHAFGHVVYMPASVLLVHYHCLPLQRRWDPCGHECNIEGAVQLGQCANNCHPEALVNAAAPDQCWQGGVAPAQKWQCKRRPASPQLAMVGKGEKPGTSRDVQLESGQPQPMACSITASGSANLPSLHFVLIVAGDDDDI
ncbi:hypothetical protein B0H14DRAFT_2605069 [Mycena olivaceomarginata]|nr:hypothetical protein B0H14DRAFT_2605069 [Mycena olivaceomarginata]